MIHDRHQQHILVQWQHCEDVYNPLHRVTTRSNTMHAAGSLLQQLRSNACITRQQGAEVRICAK
jgi:hypothetical protein